MKQWINKAIQAQHTVNKKIYLAVILCSSLSYAGYHVSGKDKGALFSPMIIYINPSNCEELQPKNCPQGVEKNVSNPN